MQEENEAVEDQVADDQKVTQESNSQEEVKENSKEYNFREMRKRFDEINSNLEKEKTEKEELRRQLEQIQKGVKSAFFPEEQKSDDDHDDLMTVGEFNRKMNELRLREEIDSVPSKYSDYYDVIKFVEPLVKENPALEDAIRNSRNPKLTAYQLVKNSYAYRSAVQKNEPSEVEKNLEKPIPAEALTGGSGIDSMNRKMSAQQQSEVWKMAQMYARQSL